MGFRKPSTKKIGLKVLAMGQTASGKSVFQMSFPKVAALDSEAGLALYEGDEKYGKNLVMIQNTMSVSEMEEAFDDIDEVLEDDPSQISTFSIDSETKFYQTLQLSALEVEEKRARRNGKDVMDAGISQRQWGRIKHVATRLQNLKIDLSAKGVHVISVSQVEDVKEKKGDSFVKVGEKPVMAKNAEYDYDIIIHLFKEEDGKGGKKYKGLILKDRTNVCFDGQIVENPSYEIWKDYYENRSGDKLETNFAGSVDKVTEALEKEDLEKEKTIVEKLKDVMSSSPEAQAKAIELIKEAKIENPLQPTANQLKKLEEIVKAVEEEFPKK
ncbi:AAA family ATPase [Priestia megaterium]|uniref:AAA family ATPase n=1 Tax=Priestia megaterium TaxID=1404 RepID=UPI002FFE1CA1